MSSSIDQESILLIVTYPGIAPHWGLFLVDPLHRFDTNPSNIPKGKFWEVILNNTVTTGTGKAKGVFRSLFPRHGAEKRYTCRRIDNYDMGQARTPCFIVSGFVASSTERRVSAAAEAVMEKFRYGFFMENCQTFVLETLQVLADWDPGMVQPEAVAWVKKNAASLTVRTIPTKTGRRERPRFTSLEVHEEERQREAEVRSRRLQSSSSTDVFSPSIAVLPRDDGVRGGQRSRTQTREKSSSKANGFHSAAVLPLDTGVKGGRKTRTDTRQTTQRVPLSERTMRKGGKSDPTPTRKMSGGWD
jgi:hypothetical protein